MSNKALMILILVLSCLFSTKSISTANASVIQWHSNGHYYTLVPGHVSWSEAAALAQSMVFEGMTGYLATVTSEAENTFIVSLLSSDVRTIPLGATDRDQEGEWRWITGEQFNYANWYDGEPNNSGDEDFAFMFGPGFSAEYVGLWNDGHDGSSGITHYVVEWGGQNDIFNLSWVQNEMEDNSVQESTNFNNEYLYGHISVANDGLIISWPTKGGYCYRVQTLDSVENNQWSFISEILCEDNEYPEGTESFNLDKIPGGLGIFRIVIVEN
jgi:hypothetical protein